MPNRQLGIGMRRVRVTENERKSEREGDVRASQ